MTSQLRLVIVIVIVVIIIAVVGILVVPGVLNQGGTTTGDTTTGGARPTVGPSPTPVDTEVPIEYIELVMSSQKIPRGFIIPPNAVLLSKWPLDPEVKLPEGIMQNLDDVINKRARTDIFRGQPILADYLVEDLANLASVGSDAAAILPTNRVAVAVPMDRITSVAYAIEAGDHVDVMVSLLFVDIDPVFQSIEPNQVTLVDPETLEAQLPIQGRFDGAFNLGGGITKSVIISPSEAQRPRMVTQRTVQEALVIWVGNFPDNGRIFKVASPPTPTPIPATEAAAQKGGQSNVTAEPTAIPRPDIITLGVSAQDAVVLTWMMEARLPITFALRSATSTSQAPTEPVDLEYIKETFRIDIPGPVNYSIQPAPDSIRQLFVGNRISLNSGGN